MTNVLDWREFADVDLTQSFVLSWKIEAETLLIDVDLVLLPNHPFYEKPRPSEKVCIRPAIIEFPHCAALVADAAGADDGKPADIASRLRLGAIDDLRRVQDGRYEIKGDFGVVRIGAERPLLRLECP